MSKHSSCMYRPRTVYAAREDRFNWAWRPRRAAMQIQQEQRKREARKKEMTT